MSMPSKPNSVQIASTEVTKRCLVRVGLEREDLPAAAERNHHLLALALFEFDVGFELLGRHAAVDAYCI